MLRHDCERTFSFVQVMRTRLSRAPSDPRCRHTLLHEPFLSRKYSGGIRARFGLLHRGISIVRRRVPDPNCRDCPGVEIPCALLGSGLLAPFDGATRRVRLAPCCDRFVRKPTLQQISSAPRVVPSQDRRPSLPHWSSARRRACLRRDISRLEIHPPGERKPEPPSSELWPWESVRARPSAQSGCTRAAAR